MSNDEKLTRQHKLDRAYKVVVSLLAVIISVAIVGIFIQIYNINLKIKSEVQQIQTAQAHNRAVNNSQNGAILGYLQCIAVIKPEDRNATVVQACVDQAQKANTTTNNAQ